MTQDARLALYQDLLARVEAALADGPQSGPEKASVILGGFSPAGIRCLLIAVSCTGVKAFDFPAVATAAAPYVIALARPDLAAVQPV
jgi:hypothetical protein